MNVPITGRGTPRRRRPPHPAPRASLELGFMHVLDVNGDGRNDVITARRTRLTACSGSSRAPDGKWTRRTIDNAWSQGHASTLVDLNGDGRLDLVTGKRFMAHNGSDPGEAEPLGVYWYEFRPARARASSGARRGRRGVDPPRDRLRRPHGRRHADSRGRYRRRRRSRYSLSRQERAVPGQRTSRKAPGLGPSRDSAGRVNFILPRPGATETP